MSTKAARGTKRTCQSSTCGSRFYDLMRDPITCPMCGSQYVVPTATPGALAAAAAAAARKPAPVPDFEMADAKADDAPEAGAEEALADLETGDEPVVVADDETFLEEEEDAGAETIGIPGAEEPEEQ